MIRRRNTSSPSAKFGFLATPSSLSAQVETLVVVNLREKRQIFHVGRSENGLIEQPNLSKSKTRNVEELPKVTPARTINTEEYSHLVQRTRVGVNVTLTEHHEKAQRPRRSTV